MGFFPCVENLLIQFTSTVDRRSKIFKSTSGNIVGWTFDPIDVAAIDAKTDEDVVLQK